MKIGIALLSAIAWAHAAGADAVRPNIVIIYTDDQPQRSLGCMGNPVISTPNMDRLAAEGVLFENMFVTTAICMANLS